MLYNVMLASATQQCKSAIIYIYLLPLEPPSHPSRSSQSTRLNSPYYIAISHQLFYSWWCVYADDTLSIHPTLSFPHCVQKSILYLHSFPSNRYINTIFSRFHIYALMYCIFLFLTYFTLHNRLYVHPFH